jgi:hypothetical protein
MRGGCGDVAAHHAEGLGERAFDHRRCRCHQAFALGNAAAARAVHADGMDFIEIGHAPYCVGEIADLLDRRDVAVHRIDRFEGDELWRTRVCCLSSLASRWSTVVAEDHLLHLRRVAHALDHRGVVPSSEKMTQSGSILAMVEIAASLETKPEVKTAAPIPCHADRRVRAREDQRIVGARNVAGAAGADATLVAGRSVIAVGTFRAGPCRDSRWSTRR